MKKKTDPYGYHPKLKYLRLFRRHENCTAGVKNRRIADIAIEQELQKTDDQWRPCTCEIVAEGCLGDRYEARVSTHEHEWPRAAAVAQEWEKAPSWDVALGRSVEEIVERETKKRVAAMMFEIRRAVEAVFERHFPPEPDKDQ